MSREELQKLKGVLPTDLKTVERRDLYLDNRVQGIKNDDLNRSQDR